MWQWQGCQQAKSEHLYLFVCKSLVRNWLSTIHNPRPQVPCSTMLPLSCSTTNEASAWQIIGSTRVLISRTSTHYMLAPWSSKPYSVLHSSTYSTCVQMHIYMYVGTGHSSVLSCILSTETSHQRKSLLSWQDENTSVCANDRIYTWTPVSAAWVTCKCWLTHKCLMGCDYCPHESHQL